MYDRKKPKSLKENMESESIRPPAEVAFLLEECPMIEMDESEHTAAEPVKWWELMEGVETFIRFNYDDILQLGSDELKRAVEIVLGGHVPGKSMKEESA